MVRLELVLELQLLLRLVVVVLLLLLLLVLLLVLALLVLAHLFFTMVQYGAKSRLSDALTLPVHRVLPRLS